MNSLSDRFQIRGLTLRNRICIPPMVIFGLSDKNNVSDANVAHYQALARGGAGLVIVEATCVSAAGRLSQDQLGIWDDSQIDGFRRLSSAVKAEGAAIFMQIHHAGINGVDVPDCPSDYLLERRNGERIQGLALSAEKISQIQQFYVDGARRAYLAGFDGVELHGCHGYLISQFLNRRVNQRTDRYGQHPEDFVLEIIEGIRQVTPAGFIVGIRLGLNEPDLADGLANAAKLAAYVDFIDASHGFFPPNEIIKPADFPFSSLAYAGAAIRQAVPNIPVFAVGGIVTPEIARQLLEQTGVDMVDIGRSSLVNPNWANEALQGEVSRYCRQCRTCIWFRDRSKCPGLKG
jgi:NADPH2 dehydrogenase